MKLTNCFVQNLENFCEIENFQINYREFLANICGNPGFAVFWIQQGLSRYLTLGINYLKKKHLAHINL